MEVLGISTEHFLSGFINYLTFGIDIIAGIIIGVAVVVAFISFLKNLKKSTTDRTLGLETARLGLARSLLLALDFEVGSDILKTILVPSITELSILAVIVTVRIVLSWSLSKELDRHTQDLKK
ncbi:MAG: DUF1622 domain-containing protein [Thermoproteota archaeon]|nr:DUF1622 domain-containing protein [Thermoproteota archaeon]